MPVLLNKGQTINGIQVPNGFVVFGLDKNTEDKLTQGGAGSPVNLAVLGNTDAAAVKALVSKDGIPYALAQSGIPFVMPSSGSVASNGNLSGLTAFNVVYGWCYCYFPAGAVFAGSTAGWYLTNLTGATIGTIYADTYTSGQPSIPATPTPIVAAGPGAYTQATGADIPGPSCIVPADVMGANGTLYWERATNNNNSANQKIYNTYLGAQVLSGATHTTNPYHGALGTVKNRGSKLAQFGLNSQNGDPGNAGGMKYLTLDTTQPQTFTHAIRLNTATDYAVIESFAFYVRPKS